MGCWEAVGLAMGGPAGSLLPYALSFGLRSWSVDVSRWDTPLVLDGAGR